MHQVYVSIGSNIDPEKHIRSCICDLEERFHLVKISSVYESKALGFEGAQFLNLAVAFQTDKPLIDLNAELKKIEDHHNRDRSQPKMSDRTLDLDILIFDELVGKQGNLTLPHPETLIYAFVLQPLAELVPDLVVPGTRKTTLEHWQAFEKNDNPIRTVEFERSEPNSS